MKFEWDSDKAASNHAKHSVEFAYATRIFLDKKHIISEDNRKEYGEPRYIALGTIEKRVYVVSFTIRNKIYRLISARKGNSREQKKYHRV